MNEFRKEKGVRYWVIGSDGLDIEGSGEQTITIHLESRSTRETG